MIIKIYGTSDDLIEIEGDIREEFNWLNSEPAYLALSNGFLLGIQYTTEGVWIIRVMWKGEGAYKLTHVTLENIDEVYSDVIEIEGDVKWVALSSEFVTRRST